MILSAPAMPARTPARFAEPVLKDVGLRATLPRMRVLALIANSPGKHLSAEDIWRLLQQQKMDIGLATIYRVLSQLEAAGLLSRNVFNDSKAVYEINDGRHHDHLVCVCCGRVTEFNHGAIETLQQEVAAQNGYRLADHRLTLYGLCRECQQSSCKWPDDSDSCSGQLQGGLHE